MSTKFYCIYVVLDITDADKEVPIARTLLVCEGSIISTSFNAALDVCRSRAELSPERKYAVFSANSFVMASKPEPKIHMLRRIDTTQKKGSKQ